VCKQATKISYAEIQCQKSNNVNVKEENMVKTSVFYAEKFGNKFLQNVETFTEPNAVRTRKTTIFNLRHVYSFESMRADVDINRFWERQELEITNII
jgi:hypothetical protein